MKPLNSIFRKTLVAASVIALICPLGAALAQSPPQTTGNIEASEYAGLEEINVTARRTEENLQDVPASVQAFGSEMLEAFQH